PQWLVPLGGFFVPPRPQVRSGLGLVTGLGCLPLPRFWFRQLAVLFDLRCGRLYDCQGGVNALPPESQRRSLQTVTYTCACGSTYTRACSTIHQIQRLLRLSSKLWTPCFGLPSPA